jgi:asparagine synthase (glutamine-hydrolysing)
MCGIAGVFSRFSGLQFDLEPAVSLLRHRGPDDSGTWNDDHVHLAHTRLSILDLNPSGHQPMSYADGRYWITFNGEIYNYLELRKELKSHGHSFKSSGDTEVLLAAFAQWGISLLDKVTGMFAFAIWDTRSKKLFLARDRCGEKPLYYWVDDKSFYFASEMKTLLAMLPHAPPISPSAIDLYFHYQYVPEPMTPLDGILKLPASHWAMVDIDTWNVLPKRYWSLESGEPLEGDPAVLIRQELERSIELTLRSDVPVGIALSGGIDSSALAAIAVKKYGANLKAFSIGYSDNRSFDERGQARAFAAGLGIDFFDLEVQDHDAVDFFPNLVKVMDDPIGDTAAFSHYSVTKLAADHGVKVVLSGLGGDELFWGYDFTRTSVRLTKRKIGLLQNVVCGTTFAKRFIDSIPYFPFMNRYANTRKLPGFITGPLSYLQEMHYLKLTRTDQTVYQNLLTDFADSRFFTQTVYTSEFMKRLPIDNAFHPFTIPGLMQKQNIDVEICRILYDTWLASNCLALGDRVSMASSVETRIPLLDYRLIQTVFRLRRKIKDYKLGHKSWLIGAIKDVVPVELLSRPKQGFRQPIEWIDGIIDKYLPTTEDSCLVKSRIISGTALQKVLSRSEDSVFPKREAYLFLLLDMWLRNISWK